MVWLWGDDSGEVHPGQPLYGVAYLCVTPPQNIPYDRIVHFKVNHRLLLRMIRTILGP